MVKTALKDTYKGVTTPIVMQNEVFTCHKIYYIKETRVVFNQSVNEFYTRFLFKVNSLLQDVMFPIDIAATFSNNLSTDVKEFLISEGFQVPPKLPTKNNH